MKELKAGEYCLAGPDKEKRIWLGNFNGKHLCVANSDEGYFNDGLGYNTYIWKTCTPIPDEQEYEYQWLIDGVVKCLEFFTEKEEASNFTLWAKIEATKRIRE